MKSIINHLVLLYFVLTSFSCATISDTNNNSDIINKTSIPFIKVIPTYDNDYFHTLSEIEIQNKMSSTTPYNLAELRRETKLFNDQILLFDKYLIVKRKIHIESNPYQEHYVRNYQAYLYDYPTGTLLRKNDWKAIRQLIFQLINEINHPSKDWEDMGIYELSEVVSITSFWHRDVVFNNSYDPEQIKSPKLTQFAKDSYIFEFYVREPWTMFSQPYTYCKLTITPDKIEFESHDVKLDGKTTDADGNIIEENK